MSLHTFISADASSTPIYCALYTDLRNEQELRARFMQEKWECAFADATMVGNIFHILAAAQRALFSQQAGLMKAKTLHAELLFQLSPRNNISEALKAFGFGDNCKSVLFIAIGGEKWQDRLDAAVQGTVTPLDQLPAIADLIQLRKHFKLDETVNSISQALPLMMSACAIKSL